MTSTSFRSDNNAYKHQLKESIGPFLYLTEKLNPCKPCFAVDQPAAMVGYGCKNRNLTDIDSELIGITRKASHCPADNYSPNERSYCDSEIFDMCSPLVAENTRLTNAPCTLRSTGWNRFEWLPCGNPQAHALLNFDTQIDTKLLSKDNHRACMPTPVCNEKVLPPSMNSKIEYDWWSKFRNNLNNAPHDVQLAVCPTIPKL
jgi:hypothetical protein